MNVMNNLTFLHNKLLSSNLLIIHLTNNTT